MKILLFFFVIFLAAHNGIAGSCVASNSIHAHLCEGKDQIVCKTHGSFCSWKEDAPQINVVIEKKEPSCLAKDGKEAHASFCKPLKKEFCSTHSNICEWK